MTAWIDADTFTDRLAGKPANEPIVLGFFGQSNCSGLHVYTPGMTVNNNVYAWHPTSTPQTGPFQWEVADPNRTSGYVGGIFTGMIGGGNGNIGWFAADIIQKATGRDVYLFTVHFAGSSISNFISNGSVEQEIATQAPAAMAAIPNGPEVPDFCIWMQGETDLVGMDDQTYIANLFQVYSVFNFKWAGPEMQWLLCDLGDGWYGIDADWDGLRGFARQSDNTVQLVSSLGAEETLDGFVYHYTGDGLYTIGQRVASCIMSGMKQRWVANDSLERA